jgi:hypothetical protein
MFNEWNDPYDIDDHYEDVSQLFAKVSEYVDPTKQISTPDTKTTETPDTKTPDTTVSKFEVEPNSIYVDGHPVGAQPTYNILRSGSPEPYRNKKCSDYPTSDPYYTILLVILFMMFVYIIHMQMQLRDKNMFIWILMSELIKKK